MYSPERMDRKVKDDMTASRTPESIKEKLKELKRNVKSNTSRLPQVEKYSYKTPDLRATAISDLKTSIESDKEQIKALNKDLKILKSDSTKNKTHSGIKDILPSCVKRRLFPGNEKKSPPASSSNLHRVANGQLIKDTKATSVKNAPDAPSLTGRIFNK